jgi:SAM-dependent methyltransferase
MTHPSASYWNQGIHNVPVMTGASTLMDGADIREHAEKLGIELPFFSVLDIGCGTGRLVSFYQSSVMYVGVDIAADAVDYCRVHGIGARLITGPFDLPDTWREWITCLSVFTHIHRDERIDYLKAFALRGGNLLVDIIPGDGSGDVVLWTADWELFQHDLTSAGWKMLAWYDRVAPTGPTHRYVRAERA